MELNFNETFVIEVFRGFDFLRNLDYDIVYVSIYGRDPVVAYRNPSTKKEISISWEGDLLVTIEREKTLFHKREESFLLVNDYFEYFNLAINKNQFPAEKISRVSNLLQTDLLKLLEGNFWIKDISLK